MCGGPSTQQQSIAGQQQQFYSTLQSGYQQNFAQQSNILTSLQNSFQPILAAGINQYGFSQQENTAMMTQATTGVANQYQAANQATQQQLAATGGGNQFLPSGASSQLTQQNAQAAAQAESSAKLGVTEAGYAQGRQNYLAAAQGLGGAATALNPTAIASSANTGGSNAYGSAQQNATQSAQMMEAIGSGIGGLASTALGAFATGGASLALGAVTDMAMPGSSGGTSGSTGVGSTGVGGGAQWAP